MKKELQNIDETEIKVEKLIKRKSHRLCLKCRDYNK